LNRRADAETLRAAHAAGMDGIPAPPEGRSGWPWRAAPRPQPRRPGWPRISIVTPSFNQAPFLEATLRSVLLQGYPELEYVVIDGGSRDGSPDLIARYAGALTHWESTPDRGQAHAINKGLARCTGEVVGWINSDDVYCPGALRRVAEAFAAHPEAVAVHGDRVLIDRDGAVAGWSLAAPFEPRRWGYPVCSETAFWRRSAIPQGWQLDEGLRFALDLDWFSRLRSLGRFVKVDAFIGCFRCYSENKSSTMQDVCAEETERCWGRHFGNDVWRVRPPVPKLRHWLTPALHPRLIGLPYLRRRFIDGKRGTSETRPGGGGA
jgi:glycosyltransferase involved in cell wall biosynthesis